MNILVVGAGVSGIFLSIFLKNKNSNLNIKLFDKNKIIGKKLLVTGNGRCNIGNSNVNEFSYNIDSINEIMKDFSLKEEEILNNFGIFLRKINDLYYPNSLSSKTLNNYLLKLLEYYKIDIHLEENIIEYNNQMLITDKNKYNYDKLIFATGGKSMKSTGSDGNLFNIFKKHNYNIIPLKPGLSPIKLNENVKSLENLRLKGLIKLINNNELIYEEKGEVIFKKDGISGISIFNINSIINRNNFKNPIISIDLYPDLDEESLFNNFNDKYKKYGLCFLESLFGKQLFSYLNSISNDNLKKYIKNLKHLNFTFKSSYDFEFSQVTIGGLDLIEINDYFESKKEKNVYFLGECLNVDGLCGGFNIMFAIYSAYKLATSIN